MSGHVPWEACWPYRGRCSCGAEVLSTSFRDQLSWRDHATTTLCQECQDDLYFRVSESNPVWGFPIRRGVLAAPLERNAAVVELGLFPFIFISTEARIEWEARFLLRSGPSLEPVDPWHALAIMRPVLEGHQLRLRLRQFDDLAASEVQEALAVDLVVVFDGAAREALHQLPFPISAECAVLGDEVPWDVLCGASLPTLLEEWTGGVDTSSSLHLCALMALALEPRGAVFRPLSFLVFAHRGLFPELSMEPPR